MEESAKLRHDFRHHLRTLMTLSEVGCREELENYIRDITVINGAPALRGGRLGGRPSLAAVAPPFVRAASVCSWSVDLASGPFFGNRPAPA